jgi:hypothetical protein
MANRKKKINVILEIEEEAGKGIKLSTSLIQKCTVLLREFDDCATCYRISEYSVVALQVLSDCTHYSHVGQVAA